MSRASISATAEEWSELADYLNGDADNMDTGNEMKPILRRWCERLHKAAAKALAAEKKGKRP